MVLNTSSQGRNIKIFLNSIQKLSGIGQKISVSDRWTFAEPLWNFLFEITSRRTLGDIILMQERFDLSACLEVMKMTHFHQKAVPQD